MMILAVGSDKRRLDQLKAAVEAVLPHVKVYLFLSGDNVDGFLEEMRRHTQTLDYAFFNMRDDNDIALVRRVRQLYPQVKVIFCADDMAFVLNAFEFKAVGYLQNPVTRDKIRELFGKMNGVPMRKMLAVHTFGNFEVYVDKKPLHFKSRKAKELMAYLVDRQGAGASTEEIAVRLWEELPYDTNVKNKVQKAKRDLRASLQAEGLEDILISRHNDLAVNAAYLECDYYRFCIGEQKARAAYLGEYMVNYSWAESTAGQLNRILGLDEDREKAKKN